MTQIDKTSAKVRETAGPILRVDRYQGGRSNEEGTSFNRHHGSAAGLLGTASAALAGDVVREVFICKLHQGKTMSDLNKVIGDFNQMIGGMKGGERYQAELLTPIAANNMNSVIWVGEMPDSATMGALTDDYGNAEAGHKMDKKFRDVIDCESRSIWHAHKIR